MSLVHHLGFSIVSAGPRTLVGSSSRQILVKWVEHDWVVKYCNHSDHKHILSWFIIAAPMHATYNIKS